MFDHILGSSRATAPWAIILFVATLSVVIVGVDVLFFRHHFFYRLIANVAIVAVFAAFGLIFLKRR